MAGPYDSMTMKALMQSLPELQRKKRRAEQLRRSQEELRQMAATPVGGGVSKTQHGGMFQTVGSYIPDYAGMGDAISGALGSYFEGKKASAAEDEYATDQSNAILSALQQYTTGGTPPKATLATPGAASQGMADRATGMLGPSAPSSPFAMPSAETQQPFGNIGAGLGAAEEDQMALEEHGPMPTQETLRAYMGMIGGPDIKDFLPKSLSDRKLHATVEDDSGQVWNVFDTGESERTGIRARVKGLKPVYDELRREWGVLDPVSRKWTRTTPPDELGEGQPVESASTGGGTISRRDLHSRQKMAESGGRADALSPAGAFGPMQLMPGTAAELEQKFGLPPGSSKNPRINEMLGRAYMDEQLERYGDDQEAALIAYNAGPGNADKWLAAGRDYAVLPKREETEPYVRKILGGGPATTTTVSTGYGGQLTPEEKARQEATGKLPVELEKKQGEADIENRVMARNNIQKTADTWTQVKGLAQDLALDPNLGLIAAGEAGSLYPKGEGFLNQIGQAAFGAYDPRVNDVAAKVKRIKSSAFMQGFQQLVGQGAGSITEAEGAKIAALQANLDDVQSEEQLRTVLQDFVTLGDAIQARWKALASGDMTGGMGAPAGGDEIPAGWTVTEG